MEEKQAQMPTGNQGLVLCSILLCAAYEAIYCLMALIIMANALYLSIKLSSLVLIK